ncbi:MAG: hypothetical protein OXL41_02760 [Nitrospinae bacterium]|nr:hypothetical protein [Nitrospinota bacterium]
MKMFLAGFVMFLSTFVIIYFIDEKGLDVARNNYMLSQALGLLGLVCLVGGIALGGFGLIQMFWSMVFGFFEGDTGDTEDK